mmetsp:Transcript_89429/g.253384  ORF Transcript_89429/g.253384 Transcript_89429/m.253384 type:complete len:243 (-) Transcript_89429:307-1035(-)
MSGAHRSLGMSGCQKLTRSTVRGAPPRCRTSCSYESSNTRHLPSSHARVSPPHVISHPSGTTRARWAVSRMLLGPQCGRRCVPGVSFENRDSPSCSAAHSATSGQLPRRRAVSGHRRAADAHFSVSPRSTTSFHSPCATRWASWAEFSFPRWLEPTLPQVTPAASTASNSALITAKCLSRSETTPKSPGSCHGLDATGGSERKWSGRCQQLTQWPPWSTSRCAICRHRSNFPRRVMALSNSR